MMDQGGIAFVGGRFDRIKKIIDHDQQSPAGQMNAFEIGDELRLGGAGGFFQQHFAITDDVIQRRAKVVFEITHFANLVIGGTTARPAECG